MKSVREMMRFTLKFPMFEVVTSKALDLEEKGMG